MHGIVFFPFRVDPARRRNGERALLLGSRMLIISERPGPGGLWGACARRRMHGIVFFPFCVFILCNAEAANARTCWGVGC